MKLKQAILAVLVVAGLSVPIATTGMAFAATPVTCPTGTLNAGQPRPSYAECNLETSATIDDVLEKARSIINVVLGFLGVVAVVVMIIGGFTFITSQGDAGKVMKGRNTLIWGLVGLVVALMSFGIVNFVIDNIDTPAPPAATGP